MYFLSKSSKGLYWTVMTTTLTTNVVLWVGEVPPVLVHFTESYLPAKTSLALTVVMEIFVGVFYVYGWCSDRLSQAADNAYKMNQTLKNDLDRIRHDASMRTTLSSFDDDDIPQYTQEDIDFINSYPKKVDSNKKREASALNMRRYLTNAVTIIAPICSTLAVPLLAYVF